jgi:ABC-type sugar transport system ATPase subunit
MPDTTMIYVTHDQVEAMTLADRIVVLKDGHLEQVGTPMDVISTRTTRQSVRVARPASFGSPAMNIVESLGEVTLSHFLLKVRLVDFPHCLLGDYGGGDIQSTCLRDTF